MGIHISAYLLNAKGDHEIILGKLLHYETVVLAITDSLNLVSVTRKKEGMKELFACFFN